MPAPLQDRRIVVTGATGQVGRPVALALAGANDVHAVARFGDPDARARLETAGITCHPVDLADPDLSGLPTDVDLVTNFAVTKTGKWDLDLRANAEAVGLLMSHFRDAEAFLHCSSTAVYAPNGGEPMAEDDPLGRDHHQHMLPTYSTVKTAAEAVARFAAREFDLPTVITRLNVPYGDDGGWPWFHLEMLLAGHSVPVHPDGSRYNPIHHDDIVDQLPAMLAAASVPATVVNWAGDDVVSVNEWVTELASLAGVEARTETSDAALPSAACDLTRQHEVVGHGCSVPWRAGFRRLVATTHPELELPPE